MEIDFRRPRFKRHYHIRTWPPDTVVLFWESGYRRLDGALFCMLAPLLNGQHSVEDMVERLEGRASALDVWFGITQLAEAGYLAEGDAPDRGAIAAFCDAVAGLQPPARVPASSKRVRVRALAGIDPKPMAELLDALGMVCCDDAELTVVLVDHPLHPELQSLHQESRRRGRPWMMVKPRGSVLALGPVFQPHYGGCWRCLTLRLRESPETQALFPLNGEAYSRFDLPALHAAALNLAAAEILKWSVRSGDQEIEHIMFTLDTAAMDLQRHVLVPREDCPDCAPQVTRHFSVRMDQPAGGCSQDDDAEAVYRRFRHHVSSLTGVVHTLEPVSQGQGRAIHVWGAGHNFTLDAGSLATPDRLGSLSRGKGLSAAQARTSALCEALERYSGVYRGNEPRRRARIADLASDAIHPAACLHFSLRQYENRGEGEGDARTRVPAPFDPARELDWTPVWSLTEGRLKYLPTACCYYGYRDDPAHAFAHADSNGCAAGSTLEDAVFRGFLELVERDSMAIWWYNRVCRPAVDLGAFSSPQIRQVREHYESLGRDLWVLDITADLQIPAVVAVSLGRGRPQPLLLGAGAHPDWNMAVASALSEINQGLELSQADEAGAWNPSLNSEPFLHPHASAPAAPSGARLETLAGCVERAGRHGLEVLVLDQTRADVGLPVTRVIVPGMRHFWRRLGPGRLYDVPVGLGWLDAAVQEEALNPAVPGM